MAGISIKDLLFGISNLKAKRYAIGTEPCGCCNETFSFSPQRRACRHRNVDLQRHCGCAAGANNADRILVDRDGLVPAM